MTRFSKVFFAATLAIAATGSALAQTAGMMSFQALLRDAGGAAVSSSVTMELRIVDSGGTQIDASGNGSVGPEDTFAVSTTATAGVVSVKYGPVAPSAFNGASRYLRATMTAPFSATLADVEIVTPPAVAEQLNARGTGNPAIVTAQNGFVGIGTLTPTVPLHVLGAIGVQGGNGAALDVSSSGQEQFFMRHPSYPDRFIFQGIHTTGYARIGGYDNVSGGVNLVLNDSGGNVGIGTTTPAFRLDVYSSGVGSTDVLRAGSSYFSDSGGGYMNIHVGYNSWLMGGGSGVSGIGYNVNWLYNGGNPVLHKPENDESMWLNVEADQFRFVADSGGIAGPATNIAEIMRITRDGNVGIGTTNPDAPLDVRSDSDTTDQRGALRVSRKSDGQNSVFLGYDDGDFGYVQAIRLGVTVKPLVLNAVGPGAPFTSGFNFLVTGGHAFFSNQVGIGTTSPAERLHVVGNICATGTIGACSDNRFKTNVVPLANALATVDNTRPVRFDWRCDEFPDRNFDDKPQIGFIAQEVLGVVPEVVQLGSDGYYSLDYGRLTPVLTTAIQELHAIVKDRDTEISNQKSQISDLRFEIDSKQKQIDTLAARLDRLEARATAQSEVQP